MARGHYIPVTSDVPGVGKYHCALIRRAVRAALDAEGLTLPCEVDVCVTDEEGIHQVNREQRGVDSPTDVLSFPALELSPGTLPGEEDADPGSGLIPLGDMLLCMDRVRAQAAQYAHAQRRELSYLVVHSTLHLLGYDHLDEGAEKARMRAREKLIMDRLGFREA